MKFLKEKTPCLQGQSGKAAKISLSLLCSWSEEDVTDIHEGFQKRWPIVGKYIRRVVILMVGVGVSGLDLQQWKIYVKQRNDDDNNV